MGSSSTNDGSSVYFYNPSFGAAVLFAILYLIPTLVLFYQTCFRYRTWYFLCVPIGSLLEVGGYIARGISVKNQSQVPPYATSLSLIVLAPLFIAAGNYLLIGRLLRAVLPASTRDRRDNHRIFHIRSTRITKLFVGCDILSFLIQVSGSSIASSNNWQGNEEKVGTRVLIVGLATQLATILIFCFIVARFAKRAVWERGAKDGAPDGWQKLLTAIMVSVTLITVSFPSPKNWS
jgi:RTA1 like protein